MSVVPRSGLELERPPSEDRIHREPRPEEVAAEAAAMYPDTFDTPPTPEEIAEEAYAIYLLRGSGNGRDVDDWLEAERAIKSRRHSLK